MAFMSEAITGAMFEVRRVQPEDSLDELTGLIHRAFEPLGRLGLRCVGVDQAAADTARRIGRGDCLLALRERRVVGTVTMEASDVASACSWYRRRDVAILHQFAVEPAEQGRGCGTLLLNCAETWARERGCRELALETPETASRLVSYYLSRGFRLIQRWHKQGVSYTSVVMSKPVAPVAMSTNPWFAPHRRLVW